MKMNKTLLMLSNLAFATFAFAQTNVFFNNGAPISITDNIDVYVGFDLQNGTAANSFISNAGRLTVKGDILNNAEITGGSFTNQPAGRDTGIFNLYGNWINNKTFKADESTVKLIGNTQFVQGTAITSFYNLEAQASANSVKNLDKIDANVSNMLTLKNGVEFATGDNKLHITSNNAGAIAYDANSFASSTNQGRLTRATSSNSDYYFPLGSSISGTATIRPIVLKPNNTNEAVFEARFVHENPSNDGMDVAWKDVRVLEVNNKFYHLISQSLGDETKADLSILYRENTDGKFSSIGRWQGDPKWMELYAEVNETSTPFDFVTKRAWLATKDEAHALIKKREMKEFEFPNVFTPNNDGNNDRFGMDEESVATLESLRIYNRWGELIFDKMKENRDTWDGSYQGKEQPNGAYTMYARVKLLNGEKVNEVRSFNLLR